MKPLAWLALVCAPAFAGVINAPNSRMPAMGMVEIDASRLMPRAVGSAALRIRPSSSTVGENNDVGAFRTSCAPAFMDFIDPIVFPRLVGSSHLHVFFGNTLLSPYTTATTITFAGNSTCPGGTANRTGYWTPPLVDRVTGIPWVPDANEIYYKSGYNGILAGQIRVMPPGLRMVAGDMKNTSPTGPYKWTCVGQGAESLAGHDVQNCPVGARLWMQVLFPQCWDGVHLDSVDHKSHMSYTVFASTIAPKDAAGRYQTQWGDSRWCPATHPIPLAEVSQNVIWTVKEADQPLRMQLSSDMYAPAVTTTTTTAGRSAHADWFNGWDPAVMLLWTTHCVIASRDCHNDLLGDGTTLY